MFGLLPRGTVYILLLVIVLYAGFQYVPVYYNAWLFHDSIRQEVRFAGTSRLTVDLVRQSVMRLAQEYAVPFMATDDEARVEVTRDGAFFGVTVYYAVPVDMTVYQHEVAFDWAFSGETFAE